MKKTLVIHPADASTQFLSVIYAGKDWTVVDTDMSKTQLKKLIRAHDRIIMMGHGDGNGLYGFDRFMVDKTFVYDLRFKECVAIWCYASDFIYEHNLKGFYTGMIISEYDEAIMYSIYPFTQAQIDESNELFASSISESIDSQTMWTDVKAKYTTDFNPIILFNKDKIYQK